MKKIIFMLIVIVFVVGVILAGCANQNNAASPSPSSVLPSATSNVTASATVSKAPTASVATTSPGTTASPSVSVSASPGTTK